MPTLKLTGDCTTNQLIVALKIANALYSPSQIQAIQFEDGSGYKFNLQINGKWEFCNLSEFKEWKTQTA